MNHKWMFGQLGHPRMLGQNLKYSFENSLNPIAAMSNQKQVKSLTKIITIAHVNL
jgi:hypothetical protein